MDLRQQAGFEAAREAVATAEGRVLMDTVLAQFTRMDEMEEARLEESAAAARSEVRSGGLLAMGIIALSAVLFLALFALVLKEARKRQEALMRVDGFFTLSLDMLCITGFDGYFKRLSPAFTQTLGWTTAELEARPLLDFVHVDDREATIAEVEKISRGVPTIQFENRYQCQDGSWRWLSWRAQPVIEEGVIYATARDVTEAKRCEDELAGLNAQLQAAAHHLMQFKSALDEHAIVATTDARGKITYVNDKFCSISKYSREEVLGKDHRIINSGHHPKPFIRDLWQTIRSGRVWHGELKNRAKDGSFYWVATTIVPFLDEAGAPAQYVAIRADITERKEYEERIESLNTELRDSAAELVGANKALEAFSYSVSHDLRAPLRHIQGYAEMLQRASDGQLSETARRYLDVIKDASLEMGKLIDDLLQFSRTDRAEMQQLPLDLNSLVREAIRALEIATRGRYIAWEIAPLPPVVGDPSLIKRVLANLLGNAVKYTGKRERAQIEVGCAGKEEGRLILFVRDDGAGFDMQYAHKLFGVFQRLHRADEFEGTGVGLANVRRIVTRHGGRVWAEGAVGEGATFYFTLQPAVTAGPQMGEETQ